MTVAGKRSKGQPLSDEEKVGLRRDLFHGMSNDDAARKYGCSDRVVQKYRSRWLTQRIGHSPAVSVRCLDRNTRKYHTLPDAPKFEAKPHMMPGLTKEMLMGGRAPVAKSGAR